MDYVSNKALFNKRSTYKKDIDFSKENELNDAIKALEEYEKEHEKPAYLVHWIGDIGGPYDSITDHGYEILPKDIVDDYFKDCDIKKISKWDPHISRSNVLDIDGLRSQIEFNRNNPEEDAATILDRQFRIIKESTESY